MFPPDASLYPDYDKWLEQSMTLETTAYFGEMFSKNLPLREFLVSDWTIMNSRLAMHYGMPISRNALASGSSSDPNRSHARQERGVSGMHPRSWRAWLQRNSPGADATRLT